MQARDWPLYTRLSGFYFLYFATAGVFVPFWSLYLQDLGFVAAQIGSALAVLSMVRVAAPLGWGWLMDRYGRRMRFIGVGMAAAALCTFAISRVEGYAALLLLHLIFALFWNAAMPAFDVVVLRHVPRTGFDYPRMRLWGSIGFIVTVLATGPVLDYAGLGLVPLLLMAGMLLMSAVSGRIPESTLAPVPEPRPQRFMQLVLRREVLSLFAACFLVQVSFAPYFGFFSLFLSAHGYEHAMTGKLWAVGVLSEVVVFVFAGRLIGHYGARAILLLALGSSALRWLSQAWLVDAPLLLTLSQLLHLSSGGLYHAVTVHYIQKRFPGQMQGRAQALLAGLSFGLGGSLGNFGTGLLWDGDGRSVYLLAAVLATLAWLIAWHGVRERPAAPA